MTAVITDLEELEELLFGDPLCEVEHEDIPEGNMAWGYPCAIVATAIVSPSCDVPQSTLICRPLAGILSGPEWICPTCGHRCFEVYPL